MDARSKAPLRKNKRILDYLKLKGQIDSYAFFDHCQIEPHEGQVSIVDAYLEKVPASAETKALGLDFDYKYKTLTVACGRRFGKSFIVSALSAEEMLYPNANVLICSYRLENCKVIFREVVALIKKLGIEIVSYRKKELELELINGARLCVASNDNVESRLGNAVSLLIIDEAKLFQRDLYENFLEPQLLDYAPYARTILISSPEEGWLQTYYDWGQDQYDPAYSDFWSISLPSSVNPANSPDKLAKLKLRLPPDVWEREYEGKFVTTAGKVFKEFSREHNTFNEGTHPRFWDWVRGGSYPTFQTIDSGYSHNFAGLYCMYKEDEDTFFVFGEYQKNKTVTPAHAFNIKNYEQEHRFEPYIRYADPAAAQQIADFVEYDLYFNKSEKNLRETINCINTLCYQKSEVTESKRLLIHSECFELIRQIGSIQWKEDTSLQTRESASGGSKPFKPDNDYKTDWDLVDALRYGLYSFYKNMGGGVSVFDFEADDPNEMSQDDIERYSAGWVKMGVY